MRSRLRPTSSSPIKPRQATTRDIVEDEHRSSQHRLDSKETKASDQTRGRPRHPAPHVLDDCRTVSEPPPQPKASHRIDDCRTISEAPVKSGGAHGIEDCTPAEDQTIEHQCEWKEKYELLKSDLDARGQADDIGLEGLTIVLHLKGRDDLVINTDLRNLE